MFFCFFVFKQKTEYEMRISDWSSDVCSSDLSPEGRPHRLLGGRIGNQGLPILELYIRIERPEQARTRIGGGAEQVFAVLFENPPLLAVHLRSEERREGKECVSKCRYWLSPLH